MRLVQTYQNPTPFHERLREFIDTSYRRDGTFARNRRQLIAGKRWFRCELWRDKHAQDDRHR